MGPITKNVRVVDELGNEYEATYHKRASGLVKRGSARFVGEQTICLARPPDILREDESMENDMELTMDYVLRRIDQVLNDNKYIYEALETVARLETFPPQMNAMPDTSRGEAVSAIVTSRETTNQQVLRILEKMYDDLKPKQVN